MPRQKRRTARTKKKPIWILLVLTIAVIAFIWWLSTYKPTEDQEAEIPVNQETVETESTRINGADYLDTAIKKAANKLQIPDNAVKKRSADGKTIYLLPVNRRDLDLTFANIIVKGQVELAGGKLDRGTETGSRQVLVFSHSELDKKYQVEIYYDSAPYENRVTGKSIAIVIDDFGTIGGDLLDGFLDLDREVSFAILPFQTNSVSTMNKARQQNRETLIHVPMEPIGYPALDPGPEAILVQMSPSEIERTINRFINHLPYCKGVNNHMGSLATTEDDVMEVVMNVLKEKGLYFLDSRTSNVSVAYQVAQKAHIPAFQNKIFLDSPDVSDATFETKLQQIIAMSNSNPNLIAITHCHNDAKLQYIKRFITRLKQAGFSLVPLSRLGQHNSPSII